MLLNAVGVTKNFDGLTVVKDVKICLVNVNFDIQIPQNLGENNLDVRTGI